MMQIRLRSLSITLRGEIERRQIDLSRDVTYVHGQVGTGKSSIARLIDFCLGGELERTPALASELVSVSMNALVGTYEVTFERQASGSRIELTWQPADEDLSDLESGHALVTTESTDIEPGKPTNFSDYMFFFFGREPILVPRSKEQEDSPLVRLGFRAFLPFCYLRQEDLDSSLLRFNVPVLGAQSRDVMRVVLGFYDEKTVRAEQVLAGAKLRLDSKKRAAEEVGSFLRSLDLDPEVDLEPEIRSETEQLNQARLQLESESFREVAGPHPNERLAGELRHLADDLDSRRNSLEEIGSKISEQRELRAELISAKIGLSRVERADEFLSSVPIRDCPSCGSNISERHVAHGQCSLCLTEEGAGNQGRVSHPEWASVDLENRIQELDDSLSRLEEERAVGERGLGQVEAEKREKDEQLTRLTREYDSQVLASARILEGEVARAAEKVRSLEETARILSMAAQLDREATELTGQVAEAKEWLDARKSVAPDPTATLTEISDCFLEALLEVGMPGVEPEDTVEIDANSLVPVVTSAATGQRWSFARSGNSVSTAGSGGKKTLFHICYALAIHRVCARHDFDLPSMLIIDTPMKNIGEDVDSELFHNFYRHLYSVAGELGATQVVIIDKEYEAPPQGVDVSELVMEHGNPEHPPLVPYYVGP